MISKFRDLLLSFTLIFNLFLLLHLPVFATDGNPGGIKLGTFTITPTSTPTPTPTTLPTNQPTITPQTNLPTQSPTLIQFPSSIPTPIENLPVKKIVSQIQYYCPDGKVTSTTYSCLDDIRPPLNPGVADILRASAIAFDNLQCVGFIQAAALLTFGEPINTVVNGAKDFTWNIPSGYEFKENIPGATINVNDIVVWTSGVYGHVAYVVKIFDSLTFQVAEANFPGGAGPNLRITTLDSINLAGWLRKK